MYYVSVPAELTQRTRTLTRGTRIEPWTPPQGFKAVPALKDIADKLDQFPSRSEKPDKADPTKTVVSVNIQTPLALFNGRIAPLVPFAIRGALWYQGEANFTRARQYRMLLPAMIADWRARHAMPLAFKAEESAAVGLFQFFSARDPDRFEPRDLYFEKSAHGWLWSPEPGVEIREKLQDWVDSETKVWQGQWQDLLLADSPVLREIGPLPAPSRDEAERVVTAWLRATRAGDVKTALSLVARLGDPRSPATVLQNLGYEITDSRRDKENPSISGIYLGKSWTAVGVKIDQGEKSNHPLYPVVQTPQGPRILIEIDLFAAGNRGRDFLNKAAFERLRKSTPAVGELQELYSQHQQNILETGTSKPR